MFRYAMAGSLSLASASATTRRAAKTLSGLTEIESILVFVKNAANSGWSLGAWPHSPTGLSCLCATSISRRIRRHSIALNGSFFNTHRMLQEYVVRAYL